MQRPEPHRKGLPLECRTRSSSALPPLRSVRTQIQKLSWKRGRGGKDISADRYQHQHDSDARPAPRWKSTHTDGLYWLLLKLLNKMTSQEDDCDGHGCGLRPQEARKNPVRSWRLHTQHYSRELSPTALLRATYFLWEVPLNHNNDMLSCWWTMFVLFMKLLLFRVLK